MGAATIIGALVGGAVYAAGSTLLGTTVLSSMLMGAALGSMFDRRPESPTYAFGPLQNTRSPAMPIPIIYGKVRVAGNIIYHRTENNGKTLYMAVGLGEGPIQSVSDIRVNDTPITQIRGAEYRVYLGTADQQADPWIHTGERFPYTAYIALKFQANEQISHTPTITCVVEGRKVQVWNGSQWVTEYSQNPAWAVLDFLRSSRYGVGIPDERLDLASFVTAASYCDELVPTEDGMEPRFRLDYVIDYERPSLDVLDDILATFRAFVLYSDGKFRLKIERTESPVYHFDMSRIIPGSFTYSKADRRNIPNQIRVEWVDPAQDYERVEAVYNNEIDQERVGEVYSKTISLLGITRPGQAGRMARFYHDSAYWCNTFCEFRVGIDALHVEVGDVIQVSHDVPGWDKKLFRVIEIQETEEDEARLLCREYNPIIYHDRGISYQPGKQTILPNPVAPPPHVTDVTARSASRAMPDGTVIPIIQVAWQEPVHVYYAGAVVYWKKVSASLWQRSPLVEAPAYDIVLTDEGQYQIRVVSESRQGIRSDFDSAPEVQVTVSTVLPPTVTGLTVDFTRPDAIIRWNPAPGVNKYRIRILNPSNDAILRTVEITGTSYIYTYDQNRADFGGDGSSTIKVSVEARNEAGNYSAQPAIVTATCPLPPQPTVQVRSDRAEIRWTVISEVPETWKATRVVVGSFSQTAPVLNGVIDAQTAGLQDGQLAVVSVALIDVFGRAGQAREMAVTVKFIDKLAFAAGLTGVEIVSALPQLPNPEYPQGSVVFLTTDNKLYRSTGTAWTAEVPTTDLSGTITETQIADDAVTTPKLKAGSVTTDKLAAEAVTADKLAANSVTAGKIAAGAVKADAIDANAVGIQHLIVGDPAYRAVVNVNASHIPNALPEGGTLFHFDHSLLSTRGLRPLPGAVATLRPGEGRFSGAVAVEEGTTNLVNLATWNPLTDNQYQTVTKTQDTLLGQPIFRAVKNSSGTPPTTIINLGTIAPGETYTASIWIRHAAVPVSDTSRLIFYDGSRTLSGVSASRTDLKWQRLIVTYSNDTSSPIDNVRVYFYPSREAGEVTYFAAPQVEKKPFATSFVAGTRAAGRLSYPKSLIAGLNALTVAAWTSGPPYWVSGNKYLVVAQTTATVPYGDVFALLQRGVNNSISLWVRNDANSSSAEVAYDNVWDGNWHLIVGVINKSPQPGRRPIELYVDGELVASSSNVNAVPDLSNIDETWGVQVGHWRGNLHWNGLIDELLILPYAASPEEIRAWYELGAPFYDAAEITVGGRGAVVINEEGAFGYSSNGVKRAGFSTDGKWVAGGRADGTFAVEADEAGLRVTAPGGEVRFNTDTNGNVFVAGELRPSILILPVRES